MNIALLIVAGALAVVLLLPTLSDLISVVGLSWWNRPPGSGLATTPRLLFLVPAHNEELLIASCVASLRALRYPAESRQIIVLADNCDDRTAEIARASGVLALERDAPQRPGKPEGLAWAFARLPLERYDAVVIVDADAVLDEGFAGALAGHAPLADKVVQCYDGVRNPEESALTRMATVLAAGRFRGAFALKRRAGLNVPLSDGMCIGTNVLRKHGWTAFSLSEDCETYAQLTAAGVSIELESKARLFAHEARNLRQSSTQRQRWLAGRLQALMRVAPSLITSVHVSWRQKLDVVAELLAPGPALHLAIAVVMLAALQAMHPAGALPLQIALGVSLIRPLCYGALGLVLLPEPWRAALAFAFLPVYACWRLGVLFRTVGLLRRGAWVRTDRLPQPAARP